MAGTLPFHDASRASREAGRTGTRFLVWFALPFAGVGLLMAASAFTGLGRGEPFDESMAARVLLGVVFGAAGLGMLLLARWTGRRAAAERTLRERHPEEPWRWRPEWAEGRVPAQDGALVAVAWVLAFFWNAIAMPLAFQLPEMVAQANHLAVAFALLFPGVGVGLGVWALRATLRRRRFGRCAFELDTHPGVIGGPVRGTVHVPSAVRPEAGVEVQLLCVHRVTTGHGKNRSTTESIRWQSQQTVPPTRVLAAAVGSAIPVAFTVPGDLPPSSAEPSDDEWLWRLVARASLPGIDFATTFEIPVFVTGASDASLRDPRPDTSDLLSAVPSPVTPGARITAQATPNGVEVRFPPARSPVGAALITAMAIFWNGLVGFMALGAPWPMLLFLAIFGLIGLVIAVGALDAWFGSIRLRADGAELEVTRRFLGIGRTRRYPADGVGDFTIKPNGHVGRRVFYALEARLPGKKRRKALADGFGDRDQAERVRALLEDALGVRR